VVPHRLVLARALSRNEGYSLFRICQITRRSEVPVGIIERRQFLGVMAAAAAPRGYIRVPIAGSRGRPLPAAADFGQSIESLIHDAGAADVGVAFHDLATGNELLIHADVNFHPASTIKIPIMMEVFRQAEEKAFSLDDRLAVKNDFVSIVDGSHFSLQAVDDSETGLYRRIGERLTIRELVRLMITESSNVATNMLVERITPDRATAFMRTLGTNDVKVLRGVEDNKAYARGLNNASTARGLMLILVRLAERAVVSAKASDEMLAILRGQKFNEGIPAGLPAGTPVAHKTGSFTKVYHDVGIIEPKARKPLVLVVFTRGIEKEPRAHRLVADITRRVFAHATPS
jgi:beta-lactamase class A